MLRALFVLVVVTSFASANAQSSTPATAIATDGVARAKLQPGTEVVKASALRMEPGSRKSPSLNSGTSASKDAEPADAESNTFRMLVAALLLMLGIALRRYQAGKT